MTERSASCTATGTRPSSCRSRGSPAMWSTSVCVSRIALIFAPRVSLYSTQAARLQPFERGVEQLCRHPMPAVRSGDDEACNRAHARVLGGVELQLHHHAAEPRGLAVVAPPHRLAVDVGEQGG